MRSEPPANSRLVAQQAKSAGDAPAAVDLAAESAVKSEHDRAAPKAEDSSAGDPIRCASPPCYLPEIEE